MSLALRCLPASCERALGWLRTEPLTDVTRCWARSPGLDRLAPVQCGQGLPKKRHGAQLPAMLSGCVNRHRVTGLARHPPQPWSLSTSPSHCLPSRGQAIADRHTAGASCSGCAPRPQAARTPRGQPGLALHTRREELWGGRLACVCLLLLEAADPPRTQASVGTRHDPHPEPPCQGLAALGQAARSCSNRFHSRSPGSTREGKDREN